MIQLYIKMKKIEVKNIFIKKRKRSIRLKYIQLSKFIKKKKKKTNLFGILVKKKRDLL